MTPRTETPIQVFQQTFSSFDELAEVSSRSDLDWRQLDGGRLDAMLLKAASVNATFEHVGFNRRFAQRGGSPSGRLTLGLIEKNVGEIGWCSRTVSTDDLLVFSPKGDNECVSRPGFQGNLMSYPEEHLAQIAEGLELSLDLTQYREGGIALRVDSDGLDELRRRLHQLYQDVATDREGANRKRINHELEKEIPVRLVRLLGTNPDSHSVLIDGVRVRAARNARDFMDAHAEESPTILEVSRAVGVSWRTLNYAFREFFGVTPKEYLQATRLNGARKQLRRRGPGSNVADIANDWGFWHMGQFAADYKRQFDELPSATLKRAHRA